jgi:hypothetical protein
MVDDHVTEMRKRNAELDDKLSPGTYAYKQIRNIVVNVAGYGVGWFAGGFIGGFFDKNKTGVANQAEKVIERGMDVEGFLSNVKKSGKSLGSWVGLVVGGMAASIYLGYEHWAKGEAARLAIDEINRDIAETKLRMNPELRRENNLLREMIAKNDVATHGREHHSKPKSTINTSDANLEASPHALGERQHG